MTDITLNGRRLTPEQSSWLVGSLQHERAYCSTPGELLELLSHPTPTAAPEVEALPADLSEIVALLRTIEGPLEAGAKLDGGVDHHGIEVHQDGEEVACVLWSELFTLCNALERGPCGYCSQAESAVERAESKRDAATQRAEAAERELAISRAETENVRTNLICVIEERDEAREKLEGANKTPDGALIVAANAMQAAFLKTLYEIIPDTAAGERDERWDVIQAYTDALKRIGTEEYRAARMATTTPPAAPCELAEELITEIMEYADPEGGKAHQLMLRAASALSAPGSEAPEIPWVTDGSHPPYAKLVIAYLEGYESHSDARWRRDGYAIMVWHNTHWGEQRLREACEKLDATWLEVTKWCLLDANDGAPLPASPAAGKEAM